MLSFDNPKPLYRVDFLRRRRITLVALVVLSAFSAMAASAFGQAERATVRVDGRTVFRIGAIGEQTAAERARAIERRLRTLLENPEAIAPARIENSTTNPADRIITVASVPVVTVAEEDARENLVTADALAAGWAEIINATLERGREDRVSAWGRFRSEVEASVRTAFASLLESIIRIVPRLFAAALVIGLFGGLAMFVRWLIRVSFHRAFSDLTVENLVKQITYYAIWGLGIIVAAAALGFDPQTVVTGLGLTSLALGFALKDIISNFISGILLLALRPFQIGDQIVVGDTEGSVERIELRATQIKTYDGRTALVPNADVFTSRVINNTASPERGGAVEFFLDYGCDLRRAISVIADATVKTDGVLQTPTPTVRVKNLTESAMQIEALFRTDSRRADFMATASLIRRNALNALKDAGIDLPDSNLRVLKTNDESRLKIAVSAESAAANDDSRAERASR